MRTSLDHPCFGFGDLNHVTPVAINREPLVYSRRRLTLKALEDNHDNPNNHKIERRPQTSIVTHIRVRYGCLSSSYPRFSKAARALMDASFRDELLERELELPAMGKDGDNGAGGLLFAKPTVRSGCEMKQIRGCDNSLPKLLKRSRTSSQHACLYCATRH